MYTVSVVLRRRSSSSQWVSMSSTMPRMWSADLPGALIGQRPEPEDHVTADFEPHRSGAWPSCSSNSKEPIHPPPSPPHRTSPTAPPADAMASRRLALSLQQGIRSRAAINAVKNSKQSPLTRGLATPVVYGAKTESTTLSNGFTVRWTRQEL